MVTEGVEQKMIMEEKNDAVFSEKIQEIVQEILRPEIKVVSFDVFDTLLFRPVMTPTDVFRLMENKLNITNFHDMRMTAEAEARKAKSIFVQDITLDDIYNTYAKLFHTSCEETVHLKNEELKIEYTILYERKTAKYLYEKAKKAGKRIIIISDMYLSSEFLDCVLKKNGYNSHERIYVSSETGVLKSSTLMYQLVLAELESQNILPKEVIHIGDNKNADVDSAIAVGMRAAHLPKPSDKKNTCGQLKRIGGYFLQDVMNSNNSLLYGVLLNLYFDDPFVDFHRSTYFNGDPRLLGYWFSPLMIGYTKWMIENVEKNGVEELLWVWRDGYLPEKLFQQIRPYFTNRAIEMKRIYLGRDMRMPFSALVPNGFFNTFADNPLNEKCTVDYFIKNRLLCKNDELQYNEILNIFLNHGYLNSENEIGRFEKYRGFLYELEPYFIKNAKAKIELFRSYIEQTINRDKKLAIFDRSPRGKSSRFLEQFFNKEIVCFTTEVYDTPKAKLDDVDSVLESYLEYGKAYINKMGWIWAQLFEIVISDRAGGFKDIISDSDGMYSVQLSTSTHCEMVKETDTIVKIIQDAILEFTEIVVNSLGNYLPYAVFDKHGIFDCTIEFLDHPHKKDAELIVNIYPGDSILSPIDETIFDSWFNRKIHDETVSKKKPWDYIRHAGYVTAERLGILLPARTLYRNIIGDPLEPIISLEKLQRITDSQIEYLNNLECSKINAIFVGSVPQEVGIYFNNLLRANESIRFIFVAAGFAKMPTWLEVPCIMGPEIFSFWGIDGQNLKIRVPDEIRREVKEKAYLNDLVERRMLRGYSESVAMVLAYEAERYFTALIEKINPVLLLVWNNWGNNSVVPCEIAKRKQIHVISAERGFLEGTIMLSPNGYGRDKININPEEFSALYISPKEFEEAKKVIEFIKSTGFNRYKQPTDEALEPLRERLNNGKSNVLLIGSFDCENPAFPNNKESEEVYSPTFSTSQEAVLHIAKLAKKNDWNLIYKPHPLMEKISELNCLKLPNTICVGAGSVNTLIDIADVVICMVSGVSYIALIHEKPLVELAYTPLKRKGCCYEAFAIKDIEKKVVEAIRNGYTNEQRRAFIRHVAQANKYYYFDDLSIRPIRYGKTIEEAVLYINSVIKGKEEI